ncbi:MAG TPA: S41 family peptidase [Sediminibacterium sp.]|nr:S41 family peptidase [Sediminibacterium sp.]
MRIILLIILGFFGNGMRVSGQESSVLMQRIAPTEMKSDLVLLKKILEANHPSLYWYTSKAVIDSSFQTQEKELTDSLTTIEFRNRVAEWISQIKCGHTVVRLPKKISRQFQQNKVAMFPLQVKVWGDSMVVLGNLHRGDTVLTRGTILQSINGYNTKAITDRIFSTISTDGDAVNHRNQVVTNSFPFWHALHFGTDSIYRIEYIDAAGKTESATIRPFSPAERIAQQKQSDSLAVVRPPEISKRQMRRLSRRSLTIDTLQRSAFMRLNTFSRGSLKSFFRKSFRKMNALQIEHLVIDLRNNSGGRVSNSTALTKYLRKQPFKIGDTVAAISRKFRYSRYIQPIVPFWLAMNFGAVKAADGAIHYRRYEQHYYPPKTKHHFNGNIYLLQGGYTFSAATMFIAALKGQENVTVIGEESGGGYYGNSAMHIPNITLPKSRLSISLPLYKLVMDKNRAKGRGIIPDILVPPSSAAIRAGVDLKTDTVLSLIKTKKPSR